MEETDGKPTAEWILRRFGHFARYSRLFLLSGQPIPIFRSRGSGGRQPLLQRFARYQLLTFH